MGYTISEQPVRQFVIDVGLRPGYETSGKAFAFDDVKEWYASWQKKRAEAQAPYFSGIVLETHFVYALKEEGEVKEMHEPSVRIEGEISKKHQADIFDDTEKILEIIFELAEELGEKAEQERVHVMFDEKFYVLERK